MAADAGWPDELLELSAEFCAADVFISMHEAAGWQVKNSFLSTLARKEGNELYKKKNHDQKSHQLILLQYTKSLALSHENSEEQALAYSNRSVLLMHLHKNVECLTDIVRALKITQSPELKKKLLKRKEKCLRLIAEDEEKEDEKLMHYEELLKSSSKNTDLLNIFAKPQSGEAIFSGSDPIPENFDPSDDKFLEEKIPFKGPLPEIKSPNLMIPNFSDSLSLEYNKKYGKHIVATRDIKPGEILAIEEAFVFPATSKIYLVCSHCLNFAWNGIPCSNCIFAIYCSEECKKEAWEKYHDIECSVLPALFSKLFSFSNLSNDLFSVRLFIIFAKSEGLESMLNLARSSDNDKDVQNITGLLTNGKLDNTKFKACYNFIDQTKHDEIKVSGKYAVAVLKLLSEYAGIFKDYTNYTKPENCTRLSQLLKLIVRIKKVLSIGAHCFQDFKCDCTYANCRGANCEKTLGIMFAPCAGLFNHSCCENVSKIFCDDGRILLFSTRPIKKNEQLFQNYGHGLGTEKKERQEQLKKYYQFTCTCEACENDWDINSPDSTPDDDASIEKIENGLLEYIRERKSKLKQVTCLHLTQKVIELYYQHQKNYTAFLSCENYYQQLCKIMRRIYGIEINMPKTCYL